MARRGQEACPGYTPEGERAGRSGVIAVISDPGDSVADGWRRSTTAYRCSTRRRGEWVMGRHSTRLGVGDGVASGPVTCIHRPSRSAADRPRRGGCATPRRAGAAVTLLSVTASMANPVFAATVHRHVLDAGDQHLHSLRRFVIAHHGRSVMTRYGPVSPAAPPLSRARSAQVAGRLTKSSFSTSASCRGWSRHDAPAQASQVVRAAGAGNAPSFGVVACPPSSS